MHIQRSLLSRATAPLLAAAALLLGCSSSETPGHEFAAGESQFGIDGSQTLSSLAVGADGAIALTGSFDHTINFGGGKLESAGGQDVFVAVLEPSGEPRWSGRTGSDDVQQGISTALTKDGEVLLAGNFSGTVNFGQGKLESTAPNAFLCRFDRAGNTLWSKKLGDDTGAVNVGGLALAPDGSVVVGGWFFGTQNFGAGEVSSSGNSSFIARYDAQGQHVFSIAFAGDANQVTTLAVDAKGAVILGGFNRGLMTFGKEFSSPYGGSAFVARLEPDGTPGWFVQFGGESNLSSLALSEGGDVVLGGTYSGKMTFGDQTFTAPSQDGFVAKLSSAGAPLWLKSFGGTDYYAKANVSAVVINGAEHALFTGSLRGTIDLGGGPVMRDDNTDYMFLAELDASGAYVRSKGFGGSGGSIGTALALDPAGGVVYGGTFDGKLDGAGQVYESRSPEDILVIRQPE